MTIKLKKTRKIVYPTNVFDATLERIRYIFDEFEEVIVSCSSWKDSTIVLETALIVAKEKNRLPLKVFFLDQESERSGTIDYIRDLRNREDIELIWCQMETSFTQSTTFSEQYFVCRDETKKDIRIRDKEEWTIQKNIYGDTDFFQIFPNYLNHHYPDKKVAFLWWVRAEESPRRYMWLTQRATYKWVTRGKKFKTNPNHFTFYPIYDWTYIDVRKAIHDNGRKYNVVYDYQYRYWIRITEMRVSSLIHETAIKSLFYLPEVDKELYNKLCTRFPGISTFNRLKDDILPKKLPFMFSSRVEYRDYLLDKLIDEDKGKNVLKKAFALHDKKLKDFPDMMEKVARKHIASILTNDTELTKIKSIDAWWLNKFLKEQGSR